MTATTRRRTAASTPLVAALSVHADAARITDIARFYRDDPDGASAGNRIMGVRHGDVFKVAKQFVGMPLPQVETHLEHTSYEVRLAAVSIMDFQARAKKVTDAQRKALCDLYLRRHDRIDNWDLVDRAAPHVVGGYLADRSRAPLTRLAKSKNPWERRTAIVATYFFIRAGDLADTFRIAALLVRDPHDLVQAAVGSWIREAGKQDRAPLLAFLDRHAAVMPKVMLRAAVEKLPAALRAQYTSR